MFVEYRGGGQQIALDAGRRADAAHDRVDLEAAVVEQLPHAALGRDEVVRVVDVPEEPALLQVVGHDDEEHAAGPEHAQRLGDELARSIDARHVLEHLVGVDDIAARSRRRGSAAPSPR